MSEQDVFANFMNRFKSEEEGIYEQENSLKDSLTLKDNAEANAKENNISNKSKNNNKKKKPSRDIFGYFINNKDNEDSDKNSIISEEENNSNDYYGQINSIEEEKSENKENSENENKDNKDANNEINNNKNENSLNNENNTYEKIFEGKDDIDTNDNQKHENTNSLEGEEFRMNSFRPKPAPDSPKFVNDNENNKENEVKNENNNDCTNFTETLATKIEGDNLIKNSNNNNNDKNNNDSIYNHSSNVISLGQLPNKDNINNESINNNKNNKNENIFNFNDDSDRQKEEDFLLEEELKRKKYKEELEKQNENKEKNIEINDFEDGRENVVDDDENEEENAQIQYLKNLEEKKKKLKKYQEEIKYNQNININNNEEMNKNNSNSNRGYRENVNQIKDMPIKLLHQYITEEKNKSEKKPIVENNLDININNNNNNINNDNFNNNKNNNDNINNVNFNNNINHDNFNNDNIINNNVIQKNNNKEKSKNKNKYKISKKKNSKKIVFKKKANIQKTGINKYSSPPKNNYDNNYINSSKNKNQSISSFNINSNKINYNKNNINNTNKIYTKKYINKIDLNNIKKQLYPQKIEIKPKLKKNKTSPFFKSPPRHRPKKAVDYHEKYSFTPTINPKSTKIWEKRNKNMQKNKTPESFKSDYNLENSSMNNKNRKLTTPIGTLLYEEANYKKEKIRQMCLTEDNNIKLNANSSKMNKNSYNMVIDRVYKKINNTINKYSLNEKLSILNIVQCLSDLKIINELIKNREIIDLNIDNLKFIIQNIKERDHKKLEELDLIEQIWIKINPNMDEYINSKIFLELLQILFSSSSPNINNTEINNLVNNIENILEKYDINQINNSINNNEVHISPLRDKNFNENDLWPLQKLIKIFLKFKNNIKVYKTNDYEFKKKELYNNLNEERDKELTFEPSIDSNYVFDKNSKFNYYNNFNNKDFLNRTISTTKKNKYDFNKIYERFMQEKKMHEKVLEKLREIKKQKELKKYTYVPRISQHSPRNPRKSNFNLYNQNSAIMNNGKKIPVYERLYSMRKKYNGNNKSIRNSMSQNFEYRERQLSRDKIINKNKKEKNNETKPKPFNISDVNIEKDGKKNKTQNNFNNKNIIDVYITIEIKIPNGELKPLKIYKNQSNIEELINDFCTENDLNEEDKEIIINKVKQYRNTFFGNNINEENNELKNNNTKNNEDMDTFDNTYVNSKNSNESNQKNNVKNEEKLNNNENEKEKENNIIEINDNQDIKLKTLDDQIYYKEDNNLDE